MHKKMAVGYFEAFIKIWSQFWVEWEKRGPTKTFLTDFINDDSNYGFLSANDIILCLILGVFFTILRYFLTETVFKPTFKWFKLLEKDQKKCPESAFKLLFYSSAYGYCSYILFSGKYDFFHDTSNCWREWYTGMPIPQDMYTLLVVEIGFYFHSLYATLYMDQWKKDSALMIMHHILTIALILLSIAGRLHRIGLLVLFLHDINDIFLEFFKLCATFKWRNGRYHIMPDILSGVGFICFTSIWFYSRLYLYPIKVLYSGVCEYAMYAPTGQFYFISNALLWILLGMNLWWFHYIVWLLIRVIIGMGHGLEDIREIPENETADGKMLHKTE